MEENITGDQRWNDKLNVDENKEAEWWPVSTNSFNFLQIAKKDTCTPFHEGNAERLLRLMSSLSREKSFNNPLQSIACC